MNPPPKYNAYSCDAYVKDSGCSILENMKTSSQKRKKRGLRESIQKCSFLHTKESILKSFFLTLAIAAVTLTYVATKSFEYEMTAYSLVPDVLKQPPSPLESEITDMVQGYPIEAMAPYIAQQDPKVAAFVVSIAKKESNWGKRVPVLNGRDCYNYWGYRGKSDEMGTGGHTCFKSRKEAVKRVSRRIETLVEEQKLDTPQEMIVWKCGSNCAGHSQVSVDKWIADVSLYFKKFKSK